MALRELKGSGGGNWFKWEKVGTEFRGRFKALGTGLFDGKTTYHGLFVDDQGKEIKVNAPTILADKLNEAEAGMRLILTYVGDKPGKGGRRGAKDFTVLVDDGTAQSAPAQEDPEVTKAKVLLAGLGSRDKVQSSYDTLAAKLRAADPAGGVALLKALEDMFPDPVIREQKLTDVLKSKGVAA